MSFLKSLSQAYGQQVAADTSEGIFPSYYACGPGGETFYVWPAFAPSPDSSDPQFSGPVRPDPAEIVAPVRCLKRRVTANRKERRRTLSINNAFADLRSCIPNIPADSKLSKIKTLRLATSYIAYLMDVLAGEESGSPPGTFKADIMKQTNCGKKSDTGLAAHLLENSKDRRNSGRTGWPQHVWALELKHENPS